MVAFLVIFMKWTTWRHRLSNKDIENKTGDCSSCGEGIPLVKSGGIWRCKIGRKSHSLAHKGIWKYRKYFIKDTRCHICKIKNEDYRFFDVHHLDGNNKNNSRKNLVLLCPNCHRLETIKYWKTLERKD